MTCGMVLNDLRRSVGQDFAMIKDLDRIRDGHDEIHIMLDDSRRHAPCRQFANQRSELLLFGRIEPGRRFVQQQHLRPLGEHACELQPLQLLHMHNCEAIASARCPSPTDSSSYLRGRSKSFFMRAEGCALQAPSSTAAGR